MPYVRTDGIVIANDWADLMGSGAMLRNPLQMNEKRRLEITAVWTNTRPDGTTDDPNLTCDAWMSATPEDLVSIGETFVTPISNWSRAESLEFCSSRLNLYCFEQ